MTVRWLRPTRGLTVVVAWPPQTRQHGIGINWRGRVTGLWHEADTPWYRWHLPPKLPPMPPDPPEGWEWGIADDYSLIHVPAAALPVPEQRNG